MPPTTHGRPNPLTALLGRPASSFTPEAFADLPPFTAFTRSWAVGTESADNLSWTKSRDGGWTSPLHPGEHFTSLFVWSTPNLVCIAVGEPEVLGVERPDGIDALTALDTVLPRPTKPLHVIAEEAGRHARVSAAAMEQLGEAMHRIRRICVETGMSLSIVVGSDIAEVQILGAKPDPIDATRVPYSDHLHYTDAAKTRYIWRPS